MNEWTIEELNRTSEDSAIEAFRACCGATSWCRSMSSQRPFGDLAHLHLTADQAFDSLTREDWLEAFSCHPKIGDLDSLRMKFAGNRQWSASEQAGASDCDEQTIRRLAEGNDRYLVRFGYLFIVCASGKNAKEMLAILETRLPNTDDEELNIASNEQRKITHLRIDKLITAAVSGNVPQSE